ncbi:MAG: ATP-binding protein, partial [Ktedonobacterales bacterium]
VGVHTDITARKELEDTQLQVAREAARHASELEATFEALTAGIVVYNATGSAQRINSSASRLLGIKTDEDSRLLRADGCFKHLMPRDERGQPLSLDLWPPYRLLHGEVLTADDTPDYLIRTLDGRDILLNVSGSPVYGADGDVAGAVLIFSDVTERRRLERRTRDSLDALLAIAEVLVQAPDAPTAAHALSEPAHLTEPPEDIMDAMDAMDSDISLPQAGSEAPSVTAPPANKIAQRLCELTRSMLGCSRVGILSVDLAAQRQEPVAVVGLSPEQEQIWRIDPAVNGPLSPSPYPDMLEKLCAGQVVLFELSATHFADGLNHYGVSTALAAPLRIGETLVGTMLLDYGSDAHDYTQDELVLAAAVAKLAALVIQRDRLLSERAEAQARELALLEANRRMDEFLSIASHELRSPLTTIKANLQFATRQLRTIRPAASGTGQADHSPRPEGISPTAPLAVATDLLQRAERQTNLLSRLVNDLIDVSRIQASKLELRTRKCNLSDIVRDVVREQRLAWLGRAISLTPPGVAVQVYGDADRLGQVVTNYLTNALKYSPAERPVAVRLCIKPQPHSENTGTPDYASYIARVEVRDEGPGLPVDKQQHIWERFHRVPGVEVQSGTGVGLGLGLHISKTIIEHHGGQVGVDSAPGKGSTFWFTIPLMDAS